MTWVHILTYVLIFIAKFIEVSLATVRNVLINRGEKLKGALLGFFEVMIWAIVVSNVLTGLSEDPIKLVVYCLAFSCGNYFGVILENKLAIGTSCIQVVIPKDEEVALIEDLRSHGFGITVSHGEGKDGPVDVLMIFLKRKALQEASDIVREYYPNAVIVVNDVRQMRNGYLRK